jgi:predicted GNAT family acetyltransferase
MELTIQHDPDTLRFYVPPENLDERDAPVHGLMANMGMVLSYKKVSWRVIDLRSTLVPPHLRGRGLGTALVRQGLDWARREGYQVIPSCPFVRDFMERNPEYSDLIADSAQH